MSLARMEKMSRKSVHGRRVDRWNTHQIEKTERRKLRKTLKKRAMDYELKAASCQLNDQKYKV